jgi:hypothetical protein
MRIETASGHTIFADDADVELLSQFSWCIVKNRNGRLYAEARVRKRVSNHGLLMQPSGRRVSMHRLLMQPPPGLIVHHKDNDGLNNRRSNLQVTTQRVNLWHARNGRASSTPSARQPRDPRRRDHACLNMKAHQP